MGGPFSSDDAVVGGQGSGGSQGDESYTGNGGGGGKGYEPPVGDLDEDITLEDHIFMVNRKNDETIDVQFCPWSWQTRSHERVSEILGCDKKDVVYSSYILGLRLLRDNTGDEHDELRELTNKFREVVESSVVGDIDDDEYLVSGDAMEENEERIRQIDIADGKISSRSVEMNDVPEGELENGRHYDVRNTAYAEVQENYVDGSLYWPGFHKVVAALGLAESSSASGDIIVRLGSLTGYINQSVDETREYVERVAREFASSMYPIWIEEGIRDKTYQRWQELVDLMGTDEKGTLESLLGEAERHVVEDGEDK